MLPLEWAFVVCSSFSSLMAFAVFITAYVFPVMRKRLFMQIIICMSICDMIGSIAASGFPAQSSMMCPAQSFLMSFFYKASWLWTTCLSYQLYSIVIRGKFGLTIWQMHAICWTVSLISTILPLTTNSYGRDDDVQLSWCFLSGSARWAQVWFLVTFDSVLCCAVFLVVYFLFRIYWRYRSMNIKESYPEVYTILDSLMLYPPGFFITWGPNLLLALMINFEIIEDSESLELVFNTLSILATQSGTVLAIIFFWKCREARSRWATLLGIQDSTNPTRPTLSLPDKINLRQAAQSEPYKIETQSRASRRESNDRLPSIFTPDSGPTDFDFEDIIPGQTFSVFLPSHLRSQTEGDIRDSNPGVFRIRDSTSEILSETQSRLHSVNTNTNSERSSDLSVFYGQRPQPSDEITSLDL